MAYPRQLIEILSQNLKKIIIFKGLRLYLSGSMLGQHA